MDADTRQLADQLKDIHEKMTPGPWKVKGRNKSTQVENFQVVGRDDSAAVGYIAQDGTEIAQLRNLLPNIIAALASQWIKITDDPATLPKQYSSWLLAHTDTGDGSPTVDEAQWDGEKWLLARSGPCDDAIYVKEQAYAYMAIPSPPEV